MNLFTTHDGLNRRQLLTGVLSALPALAVAPHALAAGRPAAPFTVVNTRIFDGRWILDADTVIVNGGIIEAIGNRLPAKGQIIDGRGATLLPGLFDAHTHTSMEALGFALRFGVTTELEMMGHWDAAKRKAVADSDAVADARSPQFGVTAPNGHPSQLLPRGPAMRPRPSATTPEQARAYVAKIIADGADYVKVMIESGAVLGHDALPMMTQETVVAAVETAHRYGKMAIAHAMTIPATQQALDAGVDGLAHLFIDQAHTAEIVRNIAKADAFVTPCLCLNASILGNAPTAFAADPRVRSRLSPAWQMTLAASFNVHGHKGAIPFQAVQATVKALHAAGVDILVGTDASVPIPALGGVAHGASVHHELQLLVQAGLTPLEALRAATSVPARRFSLSDRGRIAPGLRSDLLLVDGDPTSDISNTLNIRKVWKRGAELTPERIAAEEARVKAAPPEGPPLSSMPGAPPKR